MSTNWNDSRAAIETLVKAVIGTSCPLFFENVFNTDEPRNAVWARCTIQPVRTGYGAIGSTAQTRMRRMYGFINLQIFGPENKGTAPGLAIADIYADGVDSQTLTVTNGNIRIGITNVKRSEPNSENPRKDTGENMLTCVTDFIRDVFG